VFSVDDYGKLKPPSGGLPPKQIALLAVGNDNQHDDSNDGREFHKLKIQLLSPNAKAPCRATSGAAGYDLYANSDVSVVTNGRELVSTGVAALAPPGTYLRIAPRSGLALKGIDVVAGVVDPDFRGELKVLIANSGPRTFVVEQGSEIAQLILERIINDCDVQIVTRLPPTPRDSGGVGHADMVYLSQDFTTGEGGSVPAQEQIGYYVAGCPEALPE